MPGLCIALLRLGKHTSLAGFAKTWGPFAAIVVLGSWLLGLRFVLFWAAGLALLVLSFTLSAQPGRIDKPGSPAVTVLPTSHGAATV